MHFLVLGASGFIGRRIVAELLASGQTVTGAARDPGRLRRAFPSIEAMHLDLATLPGGNTLIDSLRGIEVVINAAGVLDGPGLEPVHVDGPARLYAAATAAGTGRVVLISAISAREDVQTGYSRTKLNGEAALRASGVPWTILRPSLVVAKGSFGGTSVLRGLAGLPFVTPVMNSGNARFSPIHARDLARAVVSAAADERFAGAVLEPCGPDTLTLGDLVRDYRRWLGFAPGVEIALPRPLVRLAGRAGDLLGGGPVSTTSLDQLAAGNAGDGAAFARQIGFAPKGISAILEAEPADVQDRWHARLFFLGVLTKATLIATWLASALVGVLAGGPMAAAFTAALGLPDGTALPLLLATCLFDVVAAALLLFDRRGRAALWVQLALVGSYTLGLTAAMPALWADPFGPLLKNVAVLALVAVNAVLSDSR